MDLESHMEEDDTNEPGDKVNDSVNSILATPLEPDFKSVPISQDDEISKGTVLDIHSGQGVYREETR